MTWIDQLERLGACEEAYRWCETQPDLETAWRHCTRGDWMVWLLYRVNRYTQVRDPIWRVWDDRARDICDQAWPDYPSDVPEALLALRELADEIRAKYPDPPRQGRIWRDLRA